MGDLQFAQLADTGVGERGMRAAAVVLVGSPFDEPQRGEAVDDPARAARAVAGV
jgi:hypothetical protein